MLGTQRWRRGYFLSSLVVGTTFVDTVLPALDTHSPDEILRYNPHNGCTS